MKLMWLIVLLTSCVLGAYGYTGVPSTVDTTTSKSAPSREGSEVKYIWSTIDYQYQNPATRDDDIVAGNLIPDSIPVLDVDAYIGKNGVKREFVTTPSILPGTPYTVSEITSKFQDGGPVLRPFPNPQRHYRGDCSSIISAFRIKVDKRGRLWVVDNGKVNAFSSPEKLCEPKILAFDLTKGDVLIKSYTIPADQLDRNSLLVNIEVEVTDDNTWVYVCDPVTSRMIVYNFKEDTSHMIHHPYFYPDPLYGFYSLNGVNFTLMDGILSMAIAPSKNGGNKLYYHSLSAGREGVVKTNILHDPERSVNEAKDFRLSPYSRDFHVSVEVVTKNGMMIFPNLEENALYAWNTRSDYAKKNFRLLYKNQHTLQFVSGLKIVGDELYVLTSRLQNAIGGVLAKGAPNYRLLVFKIDKLLFREQRPLVFSED